MEARGLYQALHFSIRPSRSLCEKKYGQKIIIMLKIYYSKLTDMVRCEELVLFHHQIPLITPTSHSKDKTTSLVQNINCVIIIFPFGVAPSIVTIAEFLVCAPLHLLLLLLM